MLLMVFWASLGLILGALGAFFGALLVLLPPFGGTLHARSFFLGCLPGQISVFCFVSSFAPFLDVFVFLLFEPLRVDFELSR